MRWGCYKGKKKKLEKKKVEEVKFFVFGWEKRSKGGTLLLPPLLRALSLSLSLLFHINALEKGASEMRGGEKMSKFSSQKGSENPFFSLFLSLSLFSCLFF